MREGRFIWGGLNFPRAPSTLLALVFAGVFWGVFGFMANLALKNAVFAGVFRENSEIPLAIETSEIRTPQVGALNIYWLPGAENPADGMTRMKSEMSPMLNLLEFGEFHTGLLRPLLGICSSEPAR